jgi:hypothetical protein
MNTERRRRRKFFRMKKESEPKKAELLQNQFTKTTTNDTNEKRRSFWRIVPGAPHLRYDPAHRLIAWQPHRVLDDRLMRRIANWVLSKHTLSLPFDRFVDLSGLTDISIHLRHGLRMRSESSPNDGANVRIKCALYCDKPVGFAIARFYETFAKNSLIEVRAFCERAAAAEWLKVPASILRLREEARPHLMNSFASA